MPYPLTQQQYQLQQSQRETKPPADNAPPASIPFKTEELFQEDPHTSRTVAFGADAMAYSIALQQSQAQQSQVYMQGQLQSPQAQQDEQLASQIPMSDGYSLTIANS
jgi:hypothetical protein